MTIALIILGLIIVFFLVHAIFGRGESEFDDSADKEDAAHEPLWPDGENV